MKQHFLTAAKIPAMQSELCDLIADNPCVETPVQLWSASATLEQYPNLSMLAIRLLTIFASTCLCESAFSKMNYIKNRHRSGLTNKHLADLLRLALSDVTDDDVNSVMSQKAVFHTSH